MPEKDKQRVEEEIRKLYFDGMTDDFRNRLQSEGKWPAKNLEQFVQNGFKTSSDDTELFTRHEIQETCPDLLVTNYSMLEYMMLRPLEANIFDQTAQWLSSSTDNILTVVLDEAHMYRGSGGAEVAYLLRRLQSRLGVQRDRIRYILTSASLGSSEDAKIEVKKFAANLTGGKVEQFELIGSELEPRTGCAPASAKEQACLAAFDASKIQSVIDIDAAAADLNKLASCIGAESRDNLNSESNLRQFAFDLLSSLPAAQLVADELTKSPKTLSQIADAAFPEARGRERAAEALLALMAFAKDEARGRPFCPNAL
jgi:hypothetical protein